MYLSCTTNPRKDENMENAKGRKSIYTLFIQCRLFKISNWNLRICHCFITCRSFDSSPLFLVPTRCQLYFSEWAEPVGPLLRSTVKDPQAKSLLQVVNPRDPKIVGGKGLSAVINPRDPKRSSRGGRPPSTAETGAAAREPAARRQNSWFKPSACFLPCLTDHRVPSQTTANETTYCHQFVEKLALDFERLLDLSARPFLWLFS